MSQITDSMTEVMQYIEDHKETYLEWLRDMARQPSVAAQNRGMKEMAEMVARYFQEQLGVPIESYPTDGHPVLYAHLGSPFDGAKTLAFYNHYDIQPEDPVELWESPPFAAEERNGKIYARGISDNKANLVARLAAVHAYLQVKKKLPLNLKFFIEGEEEIGSVHLPQFTERHADLLKADGMIWEFGGQTEDGQPEVFLGVKGMLYVELVAYGANSDLHSSVAAVIENPAWRLVWALATLKNEQEKVLIDGFYDRVIPPTDDEKELLEEMPYNEQRILDRLELDGFLLDLEGAALKEKLLFQPTCTICGIHSGYTGEGSKTVLPSEASVKLDFRLVKDQDPHEILQLLRDHLNRHGFSDLEIRVFSAQKAARTDLHHPLVKAVVRSAQTSWGQTPAILLTSPGTGPMYTLAEQFGIAAVSVGVDYPGSNAHAPNENVVIDNFVRGIKHMAALFEEFAAK
jgi:acetylornithine deacetylase/succinyl-diaminopimelate desuccinylase-like protein